MPTSVEGLNIIQITMFFPGPFKPAHEDNQSFIH